MATRAKKKPGRKASPKNKSPLHLLMNSIDATAKKRGVSLFDLEAFEENYGVKFYISTGLPDFDLLMMSSDENNKSGMKPYGFPTGRIVEICGDEQSFKTWITHSVSSRCRKMGGLVFLIQTENDFDLSFYRKFYDDKGLDWNKEVTPFVRASMATTIGETVSVLRSIIPDIRRHYEANPNDPFPVVIVLDSLAAMFSTEDKENYDKDDDKGPRMGGHAKELHDKFKSLLEDLGRYNILYLVTNQYRANLGGGMKKKIPAHDNTIRYYASLRIETTSWNTKGAKGTSLGQAYQKQKTLKVKATKIRGQLVGDGSIEIGFYPNHGFDYLGSLINAMRLSGVGKEGAGGFEFQLSADSPVKHEPELLAKLIDMDSVKIPRGKIRDFLRDNKPLIPVLEYVVYERGPREFQKIEEDEVAI